MIGEVGLDCMYPDEITREPNAATIGFLLQREHWGRGYATEAAGGVIRFGFGALRIPWGAEVAASLLVVARRVILR